MGETKEVKMDLADMVMNPERDVNVEETMREIIVENERLQKKLEVVKGKFDRAVEYKEKYRKRLIILRSIIITVILVLVFVSSAINQREQNKFQAVALVENSEVGDAYVRWKQHMDFYNIVKTEEGEFITIGDTPLLNGIHRKNVNMLEDGTYISTGVLYLTTIKVDRDNSLITLTIESSNNPSRVSNIRGEFTDTTFSSEDGNIGLIVDSDYKNLRSMYYGDSNNRTLLSAFSDRYFIKIE